MLALLSAAALIATYSEVAEAMCCCCGTWTQKGNNQAASAVVTDFAQLFHNSDGTCTGLELKCFEEARKIGKVGTTEPVRQSPGMPYSWQGHTFQVRDVDPKTNGPMVCRSASSGMRGHCLAAESDHLESTIEMPKAPSKGTLVMDFDSTLSKEHLFKTTHPGFEGPPDDPSAAQKRLLAAPQGARFAAMSFEERWHDAEYARWVMGGDARIDMLRRRLSKLRDEGVSVEICSWGEPERIESVLRLTGLSAEFDRIHGRQNCKKDANDKVVCDYYAYTRNRATSDPQWETLGVPIHLTRKQSWVKFLADNGGGPVLFADDTAGNYKGLAGFPGVTTFDNSQYGLQKDGDGLTAANFDVIEQQLLGGSVQQLRGADVPPPVLPRANVPPPVPSRAGADVPPPVPSRARRGMRK